MTTATKIRQLGPRMAQHSVWCHNCQAWRGYAQDGGDPTFQCATCGADILCDYCGSVYTVEHFARCETRA